MSRACSRAAFCLAILLALGLGLSCATPQIEVGNPVFSGLADGVYGGNYQGSMGSAAIGLTIAGGRITAVELTSFESSPKGLPAKAILAEVIEAQGLAVDVVSGASYSSRVILKAIENALEAGGRK